MSRTLKDVKVIGGPPPTEVFSMRIKEALRQELDLIAEYDHANGATDLARSWIVARASDYSNNPRYATWKKDRERKLAQEQKEREQARIG